MTSKLTVPAGATTLYPWDDDGGHPVRDFEGPRWTVTVAGRSIAIWICGTQYMGGVKYKLGMDENDLVLTSGEVDEFLAVMATARDELARLERLQTLASVA